MSLLAGSRPASCPFLESPQKGAEKGRHSYAVGAKTPHAPARLSNYTPSLNKALNFTITNLNKS